MEKALDPDRIYKGGANSPVNNLCCPLCNSRVGRRQNKVIEVGYFKISDLDFKAYWKGCEVTLPRTPFRTVLVLAANAGRLLTRTDLVERIWEDPTIDPRSVDTAIKRARRSIEVVDPSFDRIQLVYGEGYLWVR